MNPPVCCYHTVSFIRNIFRNHNFFSEIKLQNMNSVQNQITHLPVDSVSMKNLTPAVAIQYINFRSPRQEVSAPAVEQEPMIPISCSVAIRIGFIYYKYHRNYLDWG